MFAVPAFMLASLVLPAAARAIWLPEPVDPFEDHALRGRDPSTDLVGCGSSFPSDFSCPASDKCLQLPTNRSITAVLCCPATLSCSAIAPVLCDQTAQNATTTPHSEFHSDPTVPLESCGGGCCPMGASCSNGACLMQYASNATAASGSSTVASSSATQSAAATTSEIETTTTGVIVTPTSVRSTSMAAASGGNTSTIDGQDGASASSRQNFDGASFAAGFLPGLFIGAVLAGLALMCRHRPKRDSSMLYMDEKNSKTRDTLGSLGPLSRRPTFHGRPISEPAVDASAGYRTDFLRSTPPNARDGSRTNNGYSVEVCGSRTPLRTPKTLKGFLSHSPFLGLAPRTPQPTHSPLPVHLKRGTLSMNVAIRPVRSLKKQKSMHSLRRHVTQLSRASSRQHRLDRSRSGSTETIQVMIAHEPYTPDQRAVRRGQDSPATLSSTVYRPTNSTSTWGTHSTSETPPPPAIPAVYASARRGPMQTSTPTPAGRDVAGADPARLGTPDSPSTYHAQGQGKVKEVVIGGEGGLRVVREAEKRDTTFSSIMRKGGIDPEEFGMGTVRR
ncbi:hypothetical protein Tdes44962_MAKER10079 [Teratosphaeria destructans]|uniref:Uncharacterized protein n=1 Tax=Teratosphaeria destructans TaxID=418781 RepID=A0A9W7SPB0_9PEZI|nr:hypothetical protein Tdes44962_MAKER10079 [Teratosphaeria destructans]